MADATLGTLVESVHFLVERSGTEVRARCGWTAKVVRGRQPETFSVWSRDVTCPLCGTMLPLGATTPATLPAVRSAAGAMLPSPSLPLSEQPAPPQPLVERAKLVFGGVEGS